MDRHNGFLSLVPLQRVIEDHTVLQTLLQPSFETTERMRTHTLIRGFVRAHCGSESVVSAGSLSQLQHLVPTHS